ncbi:hypothetical protein C4D60_Mb09t10710 [Musa balbisiana]|uniref:Uncharacterized protein n=1 Tax=Musa balbisiana TaxID=52838 RepID=A0A4S8IFJ7_MUSBA|nr:hypothetical protein C4D60_Mb09t10710 [Musa balbisiana]
MVMSLLRASNDNDELCTPFQDNNGRVTQRPSGHDICTVIVIQPVTGRGITGICNGEEGTQEQ